jgi:hypothetical protein
LDDRIEDAADEYRAPHDLFAELARQRLYVVEGEIRPRARAVEEELYHLGPMLCAMAVDRIMRHSVSVATGILSAGGHGAQHSASSD